ncbi:MAG: hypothetical protein RI897_1291 [Verrucomicrobiota bacterium]|jgi:hypothetical protein
MKHQSALIPGILTLILIGVTATTLARMQQSHKLGNPGLIMTDELVFDEDGNVVNTNTVDLPVAVLDYTSETRPVAAAELSWLPADTTYARRYYKSPSAPDLLLTVVLMGQDRGSIHRPQICLTGQGWTIEKSELMEVPLKNDASTKLPVMRLTASKTVAQDGRKRTYKAVYVYWFVAEGHLTARHGERMWWMAKELLTSGVLQRWAYVSCLSICNPGQEEAIYNHISGFLSAAVPTFQPHPPGPN